MVRAISVKGMTVLRIEQNARPALQAVNHGHVMDSITGYTEQMLNDPKVRAAYLANEALVHTLKDRGSACPYFLNSWARYDGESRPTAAAAVTTVIPGACNKSAA
jgi:hypothetical protein